MRTFGLRSHVLDSVLSVLAYFDSCFKVGRLTVPPKIALIAAGYGDPSKRRWMRVQELRFTPAPKSASPKGKGKKKIKAYHNLSIAFIKSDDTLLDFRRTP